MLGELVASLASAVGEAASYRAVRAYFVATRIPHPLDYSRPLPEGEVVLLAFTMRAPGRTNSLKRSTGSSAAHAMPRSISTAEHRIVERPSEVAGDGDEHAAAVLARASRTMAAARLLRRRWQAA